VTPQQATGRAEAGPARTPAPQTRDQLAARLEHILAVPADRGVLALIVRRPAVDERELLEQGTLDVAQGLVGDSWRLRADGDGGPNPDAQLTVMNARAAAVVSGSEDRAPWALAGDQLYVDLDISAANLPPGTRLRIGAAVIEVSTLPHLGCAKFLRRFGVDAQKFVNSTEGRALRLRGMNARVVESGRIATGDRVHKLG
jgi:MOSC domain-containing protein YiiM